MKLKTLEIKGFKSFADKTLLQLDNSITGIVGPNGCGKSNIVDAIRWVIGEHKIKSLRSDNLEDLVFNGSRTRTASGMAEVSLTFENTRNLLPTEFTTVTITRKFFKNGESEYRLNDIACRLKDIHNLFMDTGVSSDSYAIIELAMVDDIIKDKEGARRRMLEQAAGISVYKTRKKETKSKLDATDQDLARIEDLLHEIASNLRTLENQAKKAEKYFIAKAEYKAVYIELAKATLELFNLKYEEIETQLTEQTQVKAELDAHIATATAGIEQQKLQLAHDEKELHALQKGYNELLQQLRTAESDKKLHRQKIEHLKERQTTAGTAIKNAQNLLTGIENEMQHITRQQEAETASLNDMKSLLDELKAKTTGQRSLYDQKKNSLEQLRQQHQQQQKLQYETEKKIAVAETNAAAHTKALQQIADEQQQRNTQTAQLNTQLEADQAKLTQLQAQLQTLTNSHEAIKTNIREAQTLLEQQRQELNEQNRKFDAKRNEYALLKSLVDSLEGYPESIKFLKKNNQWNNSVPLLSDLFTVQNEYRTAIEYVLEPYINYYVVPQPEDAYKAISLLETQKKGKAHFFLLPSLPEAAPAPMPGNALADAVHALSVVAVDAPYTHLAHYLLGHVYIAETLTPEQQQNIPPGIVVVLKNGTKIGGSYTLSGGSTGIFEGNKIGRAKNLERLATAIEELQQNTATLKSNLTATQDLITRHQRDLNAANPEPIWQDINKLQNNIINTKNKIDNIQQYHANAAKRTEDIQRQLATAQADTAQIRQSLTSITDTVKQLHAQITQTDADYKAAEQAFHSANNTANQHHIATTRKQNTIDSLQQQIKFKTNQIADLNKQIAQNTTLATQLAQELENAIATETTAEQQLSALLTQKETDEKQLNLADSRYYTQRSELNEIENKINLKRREKDHTDTLINALKDKVNTMKMQVAALGERLSIECNTKIDAIADEPRTGTATVEALTADADKLKKRIENMGEVNTTAIEAFSEMKVRHDFIALQRDDLIAARKSLLQTMNEAEQTANQKLKKTIEQVRLNFLQVFKALFTEHDQCDLLLTQPDNPAESPIEIYAQPKGKKPSTLTQLSGGEKTLTSTAFLFAIYLIKPAPFCILDEVDAPLDDANVGKFMNMIRQFSTNSQFIIVTHNKQTMAAVDVIYGVTMQEPGVSKLVPVNFQSLQE